MESIPLRNSLQSRIVKVKAMVDLDFFLLAELYNTSNICDVWIDTKTDTSKRLEHPNIVNLSFSVSSEHPSISPVLVSALNGL